MPKNLPQFRMMLLPGDPINDSRRGARSSAAVRIRMSTPDAQPEIQPEAQPEVRREAEPEAPLAALAPVASTPAIRNAERTRASDSDRFANAGPDCYWLEAG
jgi:hypothetical protein